MPQRDRDALIRTGRVIEAEPGTAIMRTGEPGDSAYFVLDGKLIAGRTSEEGSYQSLAAMGPGDVVGEIAALTGSTRTADVVAEEKSELLQVPADTLKQLMALPQFGPLVLGKMQERLARSTSIGDLPRFGRLDQQALRELRSESATQSRPSAPSGPSGRSRRRPEVPGRIGTMPDRCLRPTTYRPPL